MENFQQRLQGANTIQVSPSTTPLHNYCSPNRDLSNFVQLNALILAQSAMLQALDTGTWIEDSSTKHHFFNHHKFFPDYAIDPLSINTGAGQIISLRYGIVDLSLQRSHQSFRQIGLHDVWYMSSSNRTLSKSIFLKIKESIGMVESPASSYRLLATNFAEAKLLDGLKF